MSRSTLTASAVLALTLTSAVPATPDPRPRTAHSPRPCRPSCQDYCVACHGGASPPRNSTLRKYTTVDAVIEDLGALVDGPGAPEQRTMPPKARSSPRPASRR